MKYREKTEFKNSDRADILLVVNMFLTGFDAKKLNTIYVDKNLQYHGLIQAFSRTNRIMGELKSQGNVVCFRNLKKKTDEAITLFSDMDAKETIDDVLIEPYENYVARFNSGVAVLREIAENPDAVNALISEDDQVLFVKAFRFLMRTLNVLKSFTEFTWRDLEMTHQEFEDFSSKYQDIKDRADSENEGVSIIDEIDFELELIHKDEINVAYILELLADLQRIRDEAKKKQGADGAEDDTSADDADEAYERAKENILNLLGKETQLRSKRELIEQFINDYMPNLDENTSVGDGFKQFWDEKKEAAIEALCVEQKMDKAAVMAIIDEYHFSGKEPMRDMVFAALEDKPKLLERKTIFEKFVAGLNAFIRTFEDDLGGL
jgi:type I restriction enzyme R subunit